MNGSITIKELREFLATIPEEFDSYGLVNGEFADITEEGMEHTYYRLDKPILALGIDEETKELMFLHQTQEEVDEIKNEE